MLYILLFLTTFAYGQINKSPAGYDPRTDVISEKYEAGAYLMYDCEEKHWVCVLEQYYKQCEANRAEDNLQRKLEARCAPIGALPTKKSCFQRQLFMVGQNFGTRVCLTDSWKQKELLVD